MNYLKVVDVVVARVRGNLVLGRRRRPWVSLVVVPRYLVSRSRLGGSLVGQLPSGVARRPVHLRTSTLPTSATPHDLHTDSAERPHVKKTTPSPLYASATRFCNKHYFLQQKTCADPSNTSEPQYLASKRIEPQRYIRLSTNFLQYASNYLIYHYHYLYSRSLVRNHHIPLNPNISLKKRWTSKVH